MLGEATIAMHQPHLQYAHHTPSQNQAIKRHQYRLWQLINNTSSYPKLSYDRLPSHRQM
jgi:hypothetical protein